jgi:hypothetical protein
MRTQTPTKVEPFARALKTIVLGVLAVCLSLVFILSHPPIKASAATASTVNFQARLESSTGAIAPDGTYNVEFKLYDTLSTGATAQGVCSGNCKWMETRVGANMVTVTNGYLTVNLGSVTAFGAGINWDQDLYLTMNIGGTGAPSYDGEMTPRLKLTAVPYAFSAGKLSTGNGTLTSTLSLIQPTVGSQTFQIADQTAAGTYTLCVQGAATALGGCAASTGAAGYIQNTTTAQAGANFNIASNGVIGGTLTVATSVTTPILQSAAGVALLVDSGTTGALNIGTTANAKAITIGNATGATSVVINAGTGPVSIGSNATDHSTTLGSVTGVSVTTVQAGSAGISLSAANTVATGNLIVGSATTALAKLDVRGTGIFQDGGTPAAPQTTSAAEFRTSANSLITIGESAAGNANPAITLYRTAAGLNTGTGSRILNPNSSGTLQFQTGTNGVAYGTESYTTTLTLDASGNVTNTGNLIVQGSGASSVGGTLAVIGAITGSSTIQGTRLISTVATGTAPLTVASTTMVSNLNAEMLGGNKENQIAQNLRAGYNVTGGGTATYTGSALGWTNRFIVISNGNGADFSTAGYFDIIQPVATTVITGVGGHGNVTVTASGIPITSWEALYYIMPIGSGNTSLNVNFRIATYTGALVVPSNWVLVAVGNAEDATLRLGTGITLRAGQNTTAGSVDNVAFNTSVTTSILQSAAGVALLVDSGTTGALNIGTGANAKTITIGNATGATSVVINAGTGPVNIGTNATDHSATLGSTTGVSATTIQSGSAGISLSGNTTITGTLQGSTAALTSTGSLTLGAVSTATGQIKFYNSANTGSITLQGASTAGNWIISAPGTMAANDTLCLVTLNNCVGSGANSVGALDGGTANANGATISAQTLYLQSASASFAGLVSTTTQTFAGAKTFTGPATFKNASDSTTAFQVQNAASNSALNIDTSLDSRNLIINPSFETNTTGWLAKGSATITRSTAQHYFGAASMLITTTALANDGAQFNLTLTGSTTYTINIDDYAAAALSNLVVGYSSDGATEATYVSGVQGTGAGTWQRITYTFTTPATFSGTPYFFIKQTDATVKNLYVDAASINVGPNAVIASYSEARLTVGVSAATLFGINTSTPNAALEVDQKLGQNGVIIKGNGDGQNLFGETPLFDIQDNSGLSHFNYNEFNNVVNINAGNAFWGTAALNVSTSDPGATVARLVGNASQTADILQVRDSAANNLFKVGATGVTTVKTMTNSTTAFQVQNAAGANILTIDTVNGSLATGGTTRLDASGNLTNIGTITSGLINGQTISAAANFTGTLVVATSVNTPNVVITPGNGNGLGYWGASSTGAGYGSYMSNAAGGLYGPVSDYYIADNMSNGTGRGFVWQYGGTTTAALNASSGSLSIAGNFQVGSGAYFTQLASNNLAFNRAGNAYIANASAAAGAALVLGVGSASAVALQIDLTNQTIIWPSSSAWYSGFTRGLAVVGSAGAGSCGTYGCPVIQINTAAGAGNRWGIGVASNASFVLETENGSTATTRVSVSNTANLSVAGTNACTIGSGTGATSCTSDARLKNIVGVSTGNLAKIMQLQSTYYSWKSDPTNTLRLGLIAQNVQTQFPEDINTGADGYLQLDYAALVSPIIGAIQEQQSEITKNQSDIALLQAAPNLSTGGTVNGDMNIAGMLNVSGATSLSTLTVSGDTAIGGKLVVLGDIETRDITVNGHIITGGVAPTIAAGVASCVVPTVSVAGNDTSGIVTIVAGTGCASSGNLATITFNSPFGAVPKITLTPAGQNAAGVSYYYDESTISATSWQLNTGSTLVDGMTYKFSYHAEQ